MPRKNILEQQREDAETEEPRNAETPPWELVDAGRYRPRRIRGSFRGRELG
jgi:hypothetical protein